jgi:hypothetical protein
VRGFARVTEIVERTRGMFPLTVRGGLVAALAALALSNVAYASLDFVVLALGYAALGLVGLSLVAVLIGAFALKMKVAPPTGEARLLTGRFLPTDFRLPSLRYLPLVEVDVELVSPRFDRRDDGQGEAVCARHRGVFPDVARDVVVRDAFGLAELRVRLRGGAFRALPHLGKLEPSVSLLSVSAGDEDAHPLGTMEGDRIELRRYVAGDPARFIHWKIFARTGELVVRVPEYAIKSADRVAVYFVAGEGDEASSAVTLALARTADLESRVVLGCDGTEEPIRSIEDAERAVVSSYGHRGPTGVDAFMRRVDAAGPAALVLVLPAIAGPWLGAAIDLVRTRPGGARVLIGVDGMERKGSSFVERVMFRTEAATSTTSGDEVAKVVKAVRASGAEVILIDRVSGRLLDDLLGRQRAA